VAHKLYTVGDTSSNKINKKGRINIKRGATTNLYKNRSAPYKGEWKEGVTNNT